MFVCVHEERFLTHHFNSLIIFGLLKSFTPSYMYFSGSLFIYSGFSSIFTNYFYFSFWNLFFYYSVVLFLYLWLGCVGYIHLCSLVLLDMCLKYMDESTNISKCARMCL